MSAERGEVEALARAFARHLEHLRDFRGVHYVVGEPVPGAKGGEATEEPSAEDPDAPARPRSAPEAAAPVRTSDNPRPKESPYSRPSHTQSPPSNRDGSSPASRSRDPGDTQRAVARGSAETWSAAKKLAYLRERNVGDCRRCPLAETRRNIVFGVGDPEADLMFVGEAPGADEDRLGEPFVGVAGRRLDSWIEQLGLRRDQVYIANVLKCRPPGNRNPQPQEIERCSPFLHAQIRAVEPKVIVALGRFAGCLLLGRDRKLYEMRGQVHRYREPKSGAEVPLVVTYHPSYVIRREQEPRDARGAQARPDRGGAIKSEEQKVLADLERALSLTQTAVEPER